jgi:D-amino peptidase
MVKVYIVTDMEGVAGIVRWEQCRVGTPEYLAALPLLIGEVNAAVEGAFAGGASNVLVNDGHNGGYNFTYAYPGLDPRASYLTGPARPKMLCGLDDSFDAVMMVGSHPMAGTQVGNLAHTQSSKTVARYCVNGRPTGEIGQAAIIAGHYGVPLVFVSGGYAATEEARALVGNVETAAVK